MRCRSFAACGLFLLLPPLLAASEHRVQPKATYDHPDFTIHAQVLSDGAILAYYVRRPAAAQPTLVLVPETHGDRTQFYEPAFLGGLPGGLGLVIVESRGQGRSWPPPSRAQASIERYASDVLEIVGPAGVSDWFVGGHSLGGMIAIEIARRRPPGLRGVIALEGWVHHTVQRRAFPEKTPRTEAQRAGMKAQRDERYRTQRWTAEEYAALGQIWTAWSGGERILRETQYAVLSVWGDRGRERPPREALLLPDRPNIRVEWIDGADHYVTDPPHAVRVAELISRFITPASAP